MDLWFTENHSDSVRFSIRVDKQLYSEQSEYQRIDVFQSLEFGRLLALDGYVMITQKDEFIYHDMIVHVPMAVKKDIKNVLVIGAGDPIRGIRNFRKSTNNSRKYSMRFHPIKSTSVYEYRSTLPQTAGSR